MTRPRKALIAVAVVVLAIIALGLVGTFVLRPALTGPIASLSFHQSKSLPNYDGSTYEITDEVQLAEFERLTDHHAVIPELVSVSTIANDCTGGTQTTAEITYESGRVASLQMYHCGENDGVYGDFVDEATSLLSSWKDKS